MAKVGDLVTVKPAMDNVYLILKHHAELDDSSLGKCWLLYNQHMGVQRMHEKWIETLQGAEN